MNKTLWPTSESGISKERRYARALVPKRKKEPSVSEMKRDSNPTHSCLTSSRGPEDSIEVPRSPCDEAERWRHEP